VANLPSRAIAGFVADVLEDAGIPTRIVADDGGGVLPHLDALTGGAHIEVHRGDLEAARTLLAGLQRVPPGDRADDHVPEITWRSVGILLLAIALVVTVGGAFLP
jgi:hypothetical protein